VLWVGGLVAIGLWVDSSQAHRNDAGVITDPGTLEFGDVRAGDCVTISGLGDGGTIGAADITGVPCTQSHNAQAIFVAPLAGTDYPGVSSVGAQAQQLCTPKYQAYRPLNLTGFTLYPTESRWNSPGGHRAICFVTRSGDQTMTGSVVK
jgi:hypothetical protein